MPTSLHTYLYCFLGPDFPLDVIDVSRQENIRMPMSEWVEYFNNPNRKKVYNVISLEFSKTRYYYFFGFFFHKENVFPNDCK